MLKLLIHEPLGASCAFIPCLSPVHEFDSFDINKELAGDINHLLGNHSVVRTLDIKTYEIESCLNIG